MAMQESLLQHSYLKHPNELKVSLIPTPPEPGPNELLIGVAYIGIGFADLLVITGQYQNKPKLPFAGGTDFSGVVLKVGEKQKGKWHIGQKVFGISILQNVSSMPTIHHGTWSQQIIVPVTWSSPEFPDPPIEQVYPLPDWLPLVCAPAIPACYATVYCALVEKGQLKNGEVLLVLAAAGGVGLAACQMGKALGATVIAVASTKEKLDICRMEGGADYLINYHEDQNWEKTVNQITKKMGKAWEGADVIIDPVGNPTQTLKCIARNGRLIVVGFAGRGAIPETDRIKAAQLPPLPTMQMNRLMLKNIEVKGIAWGSYWLQEPATTRGHIPGALKLLEKSGFLPPVFNYEGTIRDRRRQKTPFVGLASTAKGMIELGSGHTWGKVVVKASDVDPEDHESWMAKL